MDSVVANNVWDAQRRLFEVQHRVAVLSQIKQSRASTQRPALPALDIELGKLKLELEVLLEYLDLHSQSKKFSCKKE